MATIRARRCPAVGGTAERPRGVPRGQCATRRYRARLHYTAGDHRLGIERVELLVDGKVVATDAHRGVTGARHSQNDYILTLGVYRKGATYAVRASARSEGGTDSHGQVYISKAP